MTKTMPKIKRQKIKTRSTLFTTSKKHADFFLMFVVFILTIFGLIMVYDSSVVEAQQQFNDRFHYLKFQSVYFVIGWIGLLFAGHIDYHYYRKIIRYLFLGNLFLLLLVLIPGIGLKIYGARRWLDLGITTFQPTESFKTILVLYLATWLEKKPKINQFFALMGLILGLVILEPDLGTSIVLLASSFILYFICGANLLKFALASFITFIFGLLIIFTSPYRRQRMMTFINSQENSQSSSYHIQQVTLSLGSGGLTGLGIGQSKQKYQYLPEASTDSIFAIVGEETGFIGGIILIFLFASIIYKSFKIAQKAPDINGRLIASGIGAWIGIQIFINLASMTSLIPLTGIPLPFLSYGGTSLIITLFSVGILLNISKQISD